MVPPESASYQSGGSISAAPHENPRHGNPRPVKPAPAQSYQRCIGKEKQKQAPFDLSRLLLNEQPVISAPALKQVQNGVDDDRKQGA